MSSAGTPSLASTLAGWSTGNKKIDDAIIRVDDEEANCDIPDHFNDAPYIEVKNLVWGKNDPVYRVALEEWNQKESVFNTRVDRREMACVNVTNQIYNLVGFYSVYLGVVLTAVSQLKSSSEPHCGKVWCPILLTGVGAVVTVSGVWLKFEVLSGLERSIIDEKKNQESTLARLQTFKRLGPKFRFCKDVRDSPALKPLSFWKKRIGVFVALVVVTLCFILSYFVIFCDFGVMD